MPFSFTKDELRNKPPFDSTSKDYLQAWIFALQQALAYAETVSTQQQAQLDQYCHADEWVTRRLARLQGQVDQLLLERNALQHERDRLQLMLSLSGNIHHLIRQN